MRFASQVKLIFKKVSFFMILPLFTCNFNIVEIIDPTKAFYEVIDTKSDNVFPKDTVLRKIKSEKIFEMPKIPNSKIEKIGQQTWFTDFIKEATTSGIDQELLSSLRALKDIPGRLNLALVTPIPQFIEDFFEEIKVTTLETATKDIPIINDFRKAPVYNGDNFLIVKIGGDNIVDLNINSKEADEYIPKIIDAPIGSEDLNLKQFSFFEEKAPVLNETMDQNIAYFMP